MKVKIKFWQHLTWFTLDKENLEGKELEVLEVVKSDITGQETYLIQKPDKYIPARYCEIVKS